MVGFGSLNCRSFCTQPATPTPTPTPTNTPVPPTDTPTPTPTPTNTPVPPTDTPTPTPTETYTCREYRIENNTETSISISYYDCSNNYISDSIGSGNQLTFCANQSYGLIDAGGGSLFTLFPCLEPTPTPTPDLGVQCWQYAFSGTIYGSQQDCINNEGGPCSEVVCPEEPQP